MTSPPDHDRWPLDLFDLRSVAELFAVEKASDERVLRQVNWRGFDIAVQVEAGGVRTGNGWARTVHHAYGRLEGTDSPDGEAVDCWLAAVPPETELIFVVDQLDSHGEFDEPKLMLGFASEDEARKAYLSNYPEFMSERIGNVTPLTIPGLKKWLQGGKAFEPTKEGRDVQAEVERPFIVAIDLDGTLTQKGEYDPDGIADPKAGVVQWVDRLKKAGAYLVVWTVRGDTALVSEWLKRHNIAVDSINRHPYQPPGASAKLYANVYLDDRSVDGRDEAGWMETLKRLEQRREGSL